MRERPSSVGYSVLLVAALVIVAAGIRAAADIVIPFLLSVFIAILCGPAVLWLHRRRVPQAISILIVVVAVMGGLTLIGSIAFTSLQEFTGQVPVYQARLESLLEATTGQLQDLLQPLGISIAYSDIWENFNLNSAIGVAGTTLRQFGSILTKILLVFLTVLFMLLEASRFPAKLSAALGKSNAVRPGFRQFADSVKHYLAIKTATSLATGLSAGLWLWILDVDNAFFWGLVAFLFNYIPNIGSILAAIPPCLLALLQDGLTVALLVALGYVVINVVIGSLIEPNFMGEGLGLSPLVVFISLVFWGWLLGGAGMLLSTPLTMSVKIALENNAETRWISILVGSGKS